MGESTASRHQLYGGMPIPLAVNPMPREGWISNYSLDRAIYISLLLGLTPTGILISAIAYVFGHHLFSVGFLIFTLGMLPAAIIFKIQAEKDKSTMIKICKPESSSWIRSCVEETLLEAGLESVKLDKVRRGVGPVHNCSYSVGASALEIRIIQPRRKSRIILSIWHATDDKKALARRICEIMDRRLLEHGVRSI